MHCWKLVFIVLLGLFPYYSVSAAAEQLSMKQLKEQKRKNDEFIQEYEQLLDDIGVMQRQAVEEHNHMMGRLEALGREEKEAWYQITQLQNQVRDMERWHAKMQELDDIVSTTTRNGLQSLVVAAKEGYNAFHESLDKQEELFQVREQLQDDIGEQAVEQAWELQALVVAAKEGYNAFHESLDKRDREI
jgi:predicted  nucleic acid-binding Zn-ribbon protein